MNKRRREAREYLRKANREEYETAVKKANLTPLQEEILELCIAKDYTRCKVSMMLHCSESLVKKRLGEAYEKVSSLFCRLMCTFCVFSGYFWH